MSMFCLLFTFATSSRKRQIDHLSVLFSSINAGDALLHVVYFFHNVNAVHVEHANLTDLPEAAPAWETYILRLEV